MDRPNTRVTECDNIVDALEVQAAGDFTIRIIPKKGSSEQDLRIAEAFNSIASRNQQLLGHLCAGSVVVVPDEWKGDWKASFAAHNSHVAAQISTTQHVEVVTNAITAMIEGDFTKKIIQEGPSEFSELDHNVNKMMDEISTLLVKVISVNRQIGVDGLFGCQVKADHTAGTWKELLDSYNAMADSITTHARTMANIIVSMIRGCCDSIYHQPAAGEAHEYKVSINMLCEQNRALATELIDAIQKLTRGDSGVHVNYRPAGGFWEDLVDSVNEMARKKTEDLQRIVEVTTAVSRGESSRRILPNTEEDLSELERSINLILDRLTVSPTIKRKTMTRK